MRIFDRRVFRAAILLVALALAGFAGTAEASYQDCIDWCFSQYAACVAACPPLGRPGRFACLQDCNNFYQSCTAGCS